jgi:hypothetical protein
MTQHPNQEGGMTSTDRLWGVKDLAEYLGVPI